MEEKRRSRPLPSPKVQNMPTPEDVIDLLEKQYPGARKSFAEIARLVGNPEKVRELLRQILLRVKFHGMRGKLPLGMPREHVWRLSRQLKEIAGKVELLNESPVFSPGVFGAPAKLIASLSIEERKELLDKWPQLNNLHRVLRLYSKYVEAQLEVVRGLARMNQWMRIDRYRFELIRLVRESSKKPR